ncbi:MAG TPA: hypothetical protein VL993_08875 [Stellaceae bacterium]|nr:hypothetical protein [Stellaceae bacterium]
MKKLGSFLAAGACVGLLAGSALAQSTAAPPMAAPPTAKSMPMGNMPMPKKSAKKPMHMSKTKLTCMDYAYGSQEAADCQAGKIKPPNWR